MRRHVHRTGQRRGRAGDDGARHARADRRRHARRRLAPLLRPGRRRRHQGELRRAIRTASPRTRSSPRSSASSRASACRSSQIYVYERFQNQLDECNYAPHLPEGVQIVAAERANRNADNSGYDPATYLEADLFGEEDTRSNMMRLVSQRLTKIINIPNMKDHGATGVTGCLKNIAYGSFSNVARTHQRGKSHTYSVVGTLASIEPLRSRTVLQIMDGLRGVWHGGPFARTTRYVFYPKQILFGTDPVAIDRLLLDIIDNKRKAQGAISIWDRIAELAEDGRRARARRRSQRQHHHSRAGARGVRRRRSASASTTWRRSRCRTSRYDGSDAAPAGVRAVRLLDAGHRQPRRRSRPPASSGSACRPSRRTPGAPPASPWRRRPTRSCASREALPAPGVTARAGSGVADAQPVDRRERLALRAASGGEVRLHVPAGKAALAAAEAFAYGADAVLKIDPADLASVGRDADVPRDLPAADLPPVADFARRGRRLGRHRRGDEPARAPQPAVPGRSRRPIVAFPHQRQRSAVREYPTEEAADPSAFAQKVRRQLTDEQRSLRIYGSEVVIGRLTGDGSRGAAAPAQLRRPRHRRAAGSRARHVPHRRGVHRRRGQGRAGGSDCRPTERPSSRCRGSRRTRSSI